MVSVIPAHTSSSDPQGKFQAKMHELERRREENEAQHTALTLGVLYLQLRSIPIPQEALVLIPEAQAREHQVIAFSKTSKSINVASPLPTSPGVKEIVEDLEKREGLPITLYCVSQSSFQESLVHYARLPKIKKHVEGIEISANDLEKMRSASTTLKELSFSLKRMSATETVTLMIAGALQARASDIHVEAEEHRIVLRYRIDGILVDVAELPKETWARLSSRIKLLAGLKINIMDKPQDGRFSIYEKKGEAGEERVDVRVSFLPTEYGESIVMRLLMSSVTQVDFENLGLQGQAYTILKQQIERPNGMIITTGPTGSGKTTTLYGILRKINTPDIKIITIEDPIEYELAGVNQSQVDEARGYTFANGLRSIVRQDPDVIMVGEIRDLDTAQIGIQAALTGHLVLSTLHTNSAAGTIPRFLSMGVKAFLLAPALNVMIAQRLVRRLCPECKEVLSLDAETLKRVNDVIGAIPQNERQGVVIDPLTVYGPSARSKECGACNGFGYKGRIAVFEVIPMNEEIEKVILSEKLSEYDISAIAKQMGMLTMVEDGVLKALKGITSVDEVLRVAS